MQNKHRKKALKAAFFIIFICLLLWNLGAGIFPISSLQDTGTNPPSDVTSQSETPDTELPTHTPTITLTSQMAEPSTTSTPTSEGVAPITNVRPLPAIFSTGAYASNELIVRFKASTKETRIDECLQGIDVRIQIRIEELQAMVLEVNTEDVASIFNHILGCAGVLYVEPNFLLQAADTIPNDPDLGVQYGLVNIHAPQGWDLSTGSAAVTIAIIDTGVDYGHPDLAGKLVAGYDIVNNDSNPQDDNGHGTHVAGIAAASSNNSAGIAGVSWGARIMPVKVLNASGGGTYANTANGVIWAVDHGAQVINLSLGGTGPSSVLADAINYAHGKGSIVVAAAGNTGSNFVLYPARYPNVIAVAKTNSTNNWDGSNYGPEVDLAAPGTLIYSTVIGGYDYRSGSSMAAAHVSGLAAIMKGIPGNASPDVIESQIESTALDIEFAGWDEYTGAGLIQMDSAIQLALPTELPPGEQSSPSVGGGAIPGQIPPTNTPIPTWTVTPTLPAQTKVATFTSEIQSADAVTGTPTSTLTDEANEVKTQSDSGKSTYTLPCLGIIFILLGMLLGWFYTKKAKRS